jgi:hypothetical protein
MLMGCLEHSLDERRHPFKDLKPPVLGAALPVPFRY